MGQAFAQYVRDVVHLRLEKGPDGERGMAAEKGDQFARPLGVLEAILRFALEPRDDRDGLNP